MPTLAESSLDESERRVVERLTDTLSAEFGATLRSAWLFGSRARGERPRPDSDVDLLVVVDGGRERHLSTVTGLLMTVANHEHADPMRFAVHVVDPEWVEERRRIDSFFMREVDRDKVVLAGRG